MATKLSIVDLFNNLSDGDKRKALAVLQQAEQTPCQRLGHSFKPGQTICQWFKEPQQQYICTRCGDTKVI